MFKLGFFEFLIVLVVVVIIFGPWILSKARRSLRGVIDEYKNALLGSNDSDKATKNHRPKKS